MAARPSLFCHSHDSVFGTRDGAPHEEEVPLGVHPDHPEAQLGVALSTHVSGHPLALDDPGRVGTGADGAGLPMPGIPVRCRTAAEAMAMHHALESSALGGAGNLHQLPRGKDVDLNLGARSRSLAVHREAPQHLRGGFQAGLLGVAQFRLGGALGTTAAEAQLNSSVSHLHHAAGARLDDRHRYCGAVFIEDPGHAELAADQSHAHGYSTLISTSTPAGRSSLVSASIVCGRESLMSMSRLWVRSSNCSRLFLSTCGLRSTVHRSVLTGKGIGPETCAPVFSAVRTMSAAAWSRTTWSKAFSLMRILWAILSSQSRVAGRESRSS